MEKKKKKEKEKRLNAWSLDESLWCATFLVFVFGLQNGLSLTTRDIWRRMQYNTEGF